MVILHGFPAVGLALHEANWASLPFLSAPEGACMDLGSEVFNDCVSGPVCGGKTSKQVLLDSEKFPYFQTQADIDKLCDDLEKHQCCVGV